ncbi:MAG: SDR family NAD(P)-dependent oxidoreductase [Chlamydiota bacterium]
MNTELLKNKIVFITGASSGIGSACAEHCAAQGAKLILTARRLDRLHNLQEKLKKQYHTESLALELDVQNKTAVSNAIQGLSKPWDQIDILINNAGLALGTNPIQEGNPDDWDLVINTNILGLLYVTRAILPQMIARNVGHIVNLGSVAGHDCYPGGNIYCATKHAVKAISKSLRLDLLGKSIRVTEIDPGAVHTEFSEVRWKDKTIADNFYADFTPLVANDIADAIIYCVTRPLHVNIAEMIIYPLAQASVTHLARNKTSA